MSIASRSRLAGQGLRAEQTPELTDRPPGPGVLTYGEASLFALVRSGTLRFAARRERTALRSARERLVRACLVASGDTGPSVAPAVVVVPTEADEVAARDAEYAEALSLPRWMSAVVVIVVAVVEFLFWWTLGRQFVAYDDQTSPEALQAVALALLFPAVVFGGARMGAALGYLSALPSGVSRSWYRYRAWSGAALVATMSVAMGTTAAIRFRGESDALGATPMPVVPLAIAFVVVPLLTLVVHAYAVHPEAERARARSTLTRTGERARHARTTVSARAQREWHLASLHLEAQIQRVSRRYEREVAAGEARLLRHRARYGRSDAPLVDSGPDDGVPSWLGIQVVPVGSALTAAERVLRDYGPPAPGLSVSGPSGDRATVVRSLRLDGDS